MKIFVNLSDPDGFHESVRDAVETMARRMCPVLDDDEIAPVIEARTEKAWARLGAWVRNRQEVTIEFDTDSCMARVVPNEDHGQARARETVEIDKAQLIDLVKDSILLAELEAYGVDSWDGYDDAISDAEKHDPLAFIRSSSGIKDNDHGNRSPKEEA